MSYRYDKQKKQKKFFYFFSGIFFLLILFSPLYSFLFNVFENNFIRAYTTTENIKTSTQYVFSDIFKGKSVSRENTVLRSQIARLEVDLMRTEYLESLLVENEMIISRNISGMQSSVLKKNNSNVFTINGGIDNGFNIDDLVIHHTYGLLGKITEVYDTTSLFQLFSADGSVVDGIFFPQNISSSFLGNGNALVAEIARDIEIEIGDMVYSQNQPGYILGTVSYIDFDPRDPFKKIFVSPRVSSADIQNISIIDGI